MPAKRRTRLARAAKKVAAIVPRSESPDSGSQSDDGPEPKRSRVDQSESGKAGRSKDQDVNTNKKPCATGSKNLSKIKCSALENSVKLYNGTETGCAKEWLGKYERLAP